MGRLAQTDGLTDVQREILATVRTFVDKEVIPVATELEHRDEYPTEIVERLKEMGLFGLMIPQEYGGLGESLARRLLARPADGNVLLSTPEATGTTRAWSLYRRLGFVDVLRHHRFTSDPRPFAVLGRTLPLDPPAAPGGG